MNTPYPFPDDCITTGDGVALELPPATVLSRMLSGVIDYSLLFIVLCGVMISLSVTDVVNFNAPQSKAASIVALATVMLFIPALVTALTNGRSLGKLVTRTQVVRADGGAITFREAILRSLVGIAEIWLTCGTLATIVSALSRTGNRMGDFLAGTLVIRRLSPTAAAGQFVCPPEIEQWSSIAQVHGAPASLINDATEHLTIMNKLDPHTRAQRSQTLAAALWNYVSPTPSQKIPAETFIAGVLHAAATAQSTRASEELNRAEKIRQRVATLPYAVK
ncbi:RDD family protein [Arcanobacterium canis]